MVGRTLTIGRFALKSEADVFRSIIQKRKSCFRFQPGRIIDPPIIKDIIKSTMVSRSTIAMFTPRGLETVTLRTKTLLNNDLTLLYIS